MGKHHLESEALRLINSDSDSPFSGYSIFNLSKTKVMKRLFIGIDISKDVFDYCILNSENEIIEKGQMANSRKEILEFCKKIKSLKEYEPWICMEHTGHYGYLLSCIFTEQNLCYSLLDPLNLKRSFGVVRGKTDAIDAYRIASYALSNKHKLVAYKLPSEELRKLKVLMTSRSRYSKISVQLQNGIKANKVANKSMNLEDEIQDDQETLAIFKVKIKSIEKKMLAIIKSTKELKTNYDKITSVVGIGPIIALYCIIETQNFVKFYDPRKFGCHCGLAPFAYSSGSSVRGKTRTSNLCNKYLKGILYKGAWSAIQHDPQLKRYFNRKIEEGKHKFSVANAVAFKIVLRIFAVVKRDEPYVKLAA